MTQIFVLRIRDRLPDARASFPQAALLTRPMPGWVRTVGVVTW
jgi:hypothetical protein